MSSLDAYQIFRGTKNGKRVQVPIVFLWKNVVDDIPVRQTWALKTMQF
jgi:hypothetical protein